MATIIYTSGTSGRPKGVMLSNHNLFALLPMARDMWGIQRDSVNLVAMPLFHIGGGGWAVAGMYEGARTLRIADGPDEVHKLSIARRELARYAPQEAVPA